MVSRSRLNAGLMEKRFGSLHDALNAWGDVETSSTALGFAARLVELAAYEIAPDEDPAETARLIMISVELEAARARFSRGGRI